ncbi:MAG: permease prefix domain 1-containing protein [Butyrivibrio hungatei]|nr:permease prefix domain 1-containing protein [Butyrivibrio hungatei]
MEEYIKMLLEQVRFQKAHKAIGDELRSHIEDQIENNISEGMDKETAEKIAVEDMGDPVEAGIALDKVHRPQVAWGVIVAGILVGIFGIIIKLFLDKIPTSYNPAFSMLEDVSINDTGYYIYNVVCGIAVMLILYLVDYTMVARYSRIIAAILLFSYTMSTLIYKKIESFQAVGDEVPNIYESLYKLFSWSGPRVFLLVPLFAGIIYKYKGEKYKGLAKALVWIIVIGLVTIGRYQQFRASVIVICLLAELTIAIEKRWIRVPKAKTIVSMWALFAIIPMVVIRFMYDNRSLSNHKMSLVRAFSAPTTYKNQVKEVLSGVRAFGSGTVSYFGGKLTVSARSLISSGDTLFGRESYVITKIAALLGGGLAFAIAVFVAVLIVFGFVSTTKTKNQLGMVMGIGCMLWLTVNAVLNIGVGLGLLPSIYHTSFFPFISDHKVIASYALLGIILSIYRYKDAYPQHIDITIYSKSKISSREMQD